MRHEQFLAKYRNLEAILDRKMQPRKQSSPIVAFLEDPQSRPVHDELEVCREIRNILTHNADEDGEPVVEPSESTLVALDRMIAYVSQPPLALLFATHAEHLLCARLTERAMNLMRAMNKRGFSHAPVLDGEKVIGIFSVATVFSHMLANPGTTIDETTAISAFAPLLPIDAHEPERFVFIEENATYADVKHAFETTRERNNRLAALFITATGQPDEPLLGMITPWDALGRRMD